MKDKITDNIYHGKNVPSVVYEIKFHCLYFIYFAHIILGPMYLYKILMQNNKDSPRNLKYQLHNLINKIVIVNAKGSFLSNRTAYDQHKISTI